MIKAIKNRLRFALVFGITAPVIILLAFSNAAFAHATETKQDDSAQIIQGGAGVASYDISAASKTESHNEPAQSPSNSMNQESTGENSGDAPSETPDSEANLEGSEIEKLTPGWNRLSDGTWRYGLTNGYAKTGWLKDKGCWYWLDPENGGKMTTGLQAVGGVPYHFAASGKMSVGWAKESGSWYYAASSGALQTGWLKWRDGWYWLDPENGGKMATGLFEANGEWFTADVDGATRIDCWSFTEDGWYRVDSRGEILTGWYEEKGKKYWLDPENYGKMKAAEYFAVDEINFYARANGAIATGQWLETEGRLLLAGSDGAIGVGEAYVNENGGFTLRSDDGVTLMGWQIIDGFKFYADPATGGELAKGWFDFESNQYWANEHCVVVEGWQKIDSKWYWFDGSTNGAMVKGWQKIDGTWYYFQNDGAMKIGWLKDNGSWYYLSSSGAMKTGWLLLGDTWYYLKNSGAMATGSYKINGTWHQFANSGAWISPEATMTKKAQSFSSKTNWLILVDCTDNYVGIFKGSQNNWVMHKYIRCTSGAYSSPTVKGTFTIGAKGLHFGEEKGYTCWYYTQFYGNYLFHTVLYSPYSRTNIIDGRLGINASHGCVRLSMDNAKWIYDNIPKGTKVHVY